MPDPHKLKVLEDVGYAIKPACGICLRFKGAPHAKWGVCEAFKYNHEKHGRRHLSVSIYGSCKDCFIIDPKVMENLALSGFAKFVSP